MKLLTFIMIYSLTFNVFAQTNNGAYEGTTVTTSDGVNVGTGYENTTPPENNLGEQGTNEQYETKLKVNDAPENQLANFFEVF